ncbi:helix-turn-helix domain-containing protein, partial [Streptococcus thermophilus]
MTQSELAKEINVSEKTISRWEKDDTLMKANKA